MAPPKPKSELTNQEFRDALLSVLLDPALQLASDWDITLPEMVALLEEAYFRKHSRTHNVKRSGQKMGLSRRHVFRLKARASRNALATELELADQERQTLQALLDGAKSVRQLRTRLPHVHLEQCLAALEKAGLIVSETNGNVTRHRLTQRLVRLVNPNGLRFLDGIRFALAPVIHTIRLRVERRGLGIRATAGSPDVGPSSAVALARVFSFFAAKSSLARHADLLLADLLALATKLETESDTVTRGREFAAATRAHLCVWLSEDSLEK